MPRAEMEPARQWWGRRRLRYNVGLVVAGISAFVCYVAVVLWGISIGAIPDPGAITLLTTLFQGMGYLFMMALANICYTLGPSSEKLVKPTDLEKYRQVMFGLGFWFSVALPFSIPATLIYLCVTRPSWWHA